jgi:hypothetical protein
VSSSVTVANLGYVNQSISLNTTATSYTTNESAPTVTAQVSPSLSGGYALSVYNDDGWLICVTYQGSSCNGGAAAPMNGSRVMTAYVALGDPPSTGPPTNDLRATSNAVGVSNLGYVNQSINLAITNTSYSNNDALPTVTATVSPALSGGYTLMVYNDAGELICMQDSQGQSTCTGGAPAPLNVTRTMTAYVAYGPHPQTGPPTNDIRAVSSSVTVTKIRTATEAGGPALPGESKAGGNKSQLTCQPCHGDPVSTATGSMYDTSQTSACRAEGLRRASPAVMTRRAPHQPARSATAGRIQQRCG